MAPKVSIGLPVYNGEKFIKHTLDCMLNQSFKDFELIISDDGSFDKTEEICKEYTERDSRIQYFRQPENFGMPVKNFQFVFNKSVGEYFMFASHDDHWNNDFIENMVAILDADELCSLAFSDYKIVNLQGEGEILIGVSSSNSMSSYTRYLSRIIDIQPALIFGMFRRNLVNKEDFAYFDFFEVNFGVLMALRGKIRIANDYLMSWGVDGSRQSYSITGKRINYWPFYLSQIRLIVRNFPLHKAGLPISIISLLLLKLWLKRLIRPKSFNLSFKNN